MSVNDPRKHLLENTGRIVFLCLSSSSIILNPGRIVLLSLNSCISYRFNSKRRLFCHEQPLLFPKTTSSCRRKNFHPDDTKSVCHTAFQERRENEIRFLSEEWQTIILLARSTQKNPMLAEFFLIASERRVFKPSDFLYVVLIFLYN